MEIYTKLEGIKITHRQWGRAYILHNDYITGTYFRDGEGYFVVTNRKITDGEIKTIVNSLQSLSDDPLYDDNKKVFMNGKFYNTTPENLNKWIDNEITDIDSAKEVIKELANVINTLVNRTDLNQV